MGGVVGIGTNLYAPLVVIIFLLSCSNQEFSGSSQRFGGNGQRDGGDPGGRNNKEKRFAIDTNKGLVDILWLIDTSGSMTEETANVKKNFGSLLSNLSRQTRAKLTLVAHENAIKLPGDALSSGHVQINQTVSSTNALVIAKSLLNAGTVQLRDGARLVLVVVTDDNATHVTDANFLQDLNNAVSQKKPAVFAFRGDVSKPNCSVARKGVAYENLAQITGGQVFDICDFDWTPNFDKLVSSVEALANSSYKIEDGDYESVSKVILDGLVLEPRDYDVVDREVQINPGLISVNSKELIVKYRVKANSK